VVLKKTVYAKFDDKATDDEIGNTGEDMAWDHADSYGAVEEWEEENPEVEFELDYSWSYIAEKLRLANEKAKEILAKAI
jgi:hypothetical protein